MDTENLTDIFLEAIDVPERRVAAAYAAIQGLVKAADLRDDIIHAAKHTDTAPTEAQQEAGNYRKGRMSFHGIPIAIENPKNSVRSGKSKDGKEWSVTMTAHYGYVCQTDGKDGDPVDVFIGPDHEAKNVYVINQVDKDGKFDEHKCMLAYKSEADARAGYLSNYAKGWTGLGSLKAMTLEAFKTWLADGDLHKNAKSP